jgi:hypothetical protein
LSRKLERVILKEKSNSKRSLGATTKPLTDKPRMVASDAVRLLEQVAMHAIRAYLENWPVLRMNYHQK